VALAWLLRNPVVSTTVVGATTIEELRSDLGALSVQLDVEVVERLDQIWPGPGEAPQAYAWYGRPPVPATGPLLADAHAFFSSDEHQAAMRDLYRQRWQYTHFAALWEITTPRQRVIFCQQCDGVTPATDGVCAGCGTELFDPFAIPSHSEPMAHSLS
jgi:hypothetical protein